MHPIFDYPGYPWHIVEAMKLRNQLALVINASNDIDVAYKECGPGLPQLLFAQTPENIWKDALENLSKNLLVRKLCENQQKNPSPVLKETIQKVMDLKSVTDPDYVLDTVLMLDREPVKLKLDILASPNNTVKVLLIRGDTQSGKSYCRHLFEEKARERNAEPVYMYPEIHPSLRAVLFELLVAVEVPTEKVDKILDEMPSTTDPAWFSEMCRTLQSEAKAAQIKSGRSKLVWIAMDGLTEGIADIRSFFNQFVMHMVGPQFNQYFRLMLIHYPDGKLPTNWKDEVWKDARTDQEDVKKVHVEQYIKNWCQKNNKQISADTVAKEADRIIADAEAPLPPGTEEPLPTRIKRLHDGVAEYLKTL